MKGRGMRLTSIAALITTIATVSTADAQVRAFSWSSIAPQFRDTMTPMVRAFPGAQPEVLAAQLNALPSGRRVLLILNFTEPLALHPEDRCRTVGPNETSTATGFQGPWLEHGEQALMQEMVQFFDSLKAAGAKIDSLVVDNETDNGAGRFLDGNGAHLAAVRADPRFAGLAQRLGFDDPTVDNLWYGTDRHRRWNEVLLADFDAAHHRAVAAPFLARWPSATVSNYGSAPVAQDNPIPDMSGHATVRGGTGFGTHDSIDFYGLALQWLERASYRGVRLDDTPFDMFRINIHRFRAVDRSSEKPMFPWIGSWGLGARQERDDYPSPLSMSEYWRENVIQLAMHGCDTLYLFNPHAWRPEHDASKFNVISDQERLHDLIADLNQRLVGAADSRWLRMPKLNESVIATGRAIPGGRLWRFSFAPGVDGIAIACADGVVRRVQRTNGESGAWFMEPSGQPLLVRPDGSEVAIAIAEPGLAWPDVNGDGMLSAADGDIIRRLTGTVADAADIDGNGIVQGADAEAAQSQWEAWRTLATRAPLSGDAAMAAECAPATSALRRAVAAAFRFDAASTVVDARARSVSTLLAPIAPLAIASTPSSPAATPAARTSQVVATASAQAKTVAQSNAMAIARANAAALAKVQVPAKVRVPAKVNSATKAQSPTTVATPAMKQPAAASSAKAGRTR